MQRIVPDPAGMHAFGIALAALLRAGDLVVLTGPLGAGKTTLARGLGDGLHVRGAVISPTFVLARTHPSTIGGPPLVHVDAYRLSSAMELDDLDIDFANSIVVVEWGRGLLDGITESWLDIEIERPTGASAVVAASRLTASGADAAAHAPRAESVAAASVAAASVAAASVTDAFVTDAAYDLALDIDEPRTLTITPHGPRWPFEFDGDFGPKGTNRPR